MTVLLSFAAAVMLGLRRFRPLLVNVLLLPAQTIPVAAHNGAVAIAVPVEGVVVDGDLSDWPANMVRYPLALAEFALPLTGKGDFRGWFRVGYNQADQALYVAVEISDDFLVRKPLDNTVVQDGCDIHLDVPHREGVEPTAQYHLWGASRIGQGLAREERMQVEAKWGEKSRQYEWRIGISDSSAAVHLRPGAVLGFDLTSYDIDEENALYGTWMAWGKGTEKEHFSDMLGDLLLVGADWQPSLIKGQMLWVGLADPAARAKVQLHRADGVGARLTIETDRRGFFSAEVPAGTYRVEPGMGRQGKGSVTVQIGVGAEEAIKLMAPKPYGLKVPAGSGKTMPAGQGLGQGLWKTWGSADGMPLATVGAILQDGQGRLWLGTGTYLGGRGLARYDGAEVVHFSTDDGLPNEDIRALVEDRNGHIWIATMNGVARYDGTHFTLFTTQDGLLHNLVQSAVEDSQGKLWFGTGLGLSRYDGDRFVNFTVEDGLASSQVYAMATDREGDLWFGTDTGVNRYDGHRMRAFGPEEGWRYLQTKGIAADKAGDLWFGTRSGPVRYDGETFVMDSGFQSAINALTVDRDGHLWFGTWGEGIMRYDGRDWISYTVEDGLANGQIWSLMADREGRIWAGAMGGNISRFDERHLRNFTTKDGLRHNLVKAVVQDGKGDMFFGTIRGANRYDGRQWTTYTNTDGFAGSYIWSGWADRSGQVWLGEQGSGVYRFDGENWIPYTVQDGLAGGIVFTCYQDRAGHMWFGTNMGASRFDGEQWISYRTGDGLLNNRVHAVLQDSNGHWWFGTDEGVSRYDGEDFVSFTAADGRLGPGWVLSIIEDRKGYLWFGTWGGLSRYDGREWSTFGIAEGLSHDRIKSLLEDDSGRLWIGTWGGGITRYDGKVFQKILKADGLAHDLVQHLFQDRDGHIWIATEGGVSRYRTFPTPPTIKLTALLADKRYDPTGSVRVPSSQGLFIFEFQGASLQTPSERLTYLYRLQGYDQGWRQTHDRRVEYVDLPIGEFTFEAQVVDRDLNYSAPARLGLEVYFQPKVSPLRIGEIALDPLFSSFYKNYARKPLGTVELVNDGADSAWVTLGFFLPDWMRRSQQDLVLAPQTTTVLPLYATLDPSLLKLTEVVENAAEVTLAFAAGDETISIQKSAGLLIYGRGTLTWDKVGRAAAFITPTAPSVATFARSLRKTFADQIEALGLPGQHLLQALVFFEGLKAYGVRYVTDPNNPYARVRADQAVVDHIQYPAQLLDSKAGDCDDLTVLYASLLESVGISTALVNAPGHIFLLFDSGVNRRQAYQLPVAAQRYVVRGERLWIPVEVTQVDQSFLQAWQTGLELLSRDTSLGLNGRIVDTATAWTEYPATNPPFEGQIQMPQLHSFERAVTDQATALKGLIDAYIDETYLDRLQVEPDNDGLRTRLLKVYLALGQVETAIHQGATYLLDERGDKAATLAHLGNAYALKGDMTQAALYYKQALVLRPEDGGLKRNLTLALQALGRTQAVSSDSLMAASAEKTKARSPALRVESFYWIE